MTLSKISYDFSKTHFGIDAISSVLIEKSRFCFFTKVIWLVMTTQVHLTPKRIVSLSYDLCEALVGGCNYSKEKTEVTRMPFEVHVQPTVPTADNFL